MMKQPFHTIDNLGYMNMHSNLKFWAANKKKPSVEAIKTTLNSFESDQTAVMYLFIEHGI
jgi:hypothetical protein